MTYHILLAKRLIRQYAISRSFFGAREGKKTPDRSLILYLPVYTIFKLDFLETNEPCLNYRQSYREAPTEKFQDSNVRDVTRFNFRRPSLTQVPSLAVLTRQSTSGLGQGLKSFIGCPLESAPMELRPCLLTASISWLWPDGRQRAPLSSGGMETQFKLFQEVPSRRVSYYMINIKLLPTMFT